MPDAGALNFIVRQFFELEPEKAAHCLEAMEEEQAIAVLKIMPPELMGRIFSSLQPNFAASLFKSFPVDFLTAVAEKFDPQQGAALLLQLPQGEREALLAGFPEKIKKQIREILTYPENSAGRIMSLEFLAFHSEITVQNAIHKIRQLEARKKSPSSYAYVVDKDHRLAGVMNMRDLMLAAPDAKLEAVMRKDLFFINCFMDREQIAEEFSRRRYFAAPVVDEERRLLGIIRAEQLLEDVQEEATEDLQKMFGAGGDERVFSPVKFSLRMRLPWLHVNLATAFLAGSVVALFEKTIGKFPVLAIYLPVVAGQGGNAGAQSLAIVIRGIVMREIRASKVWRLIFKEAGIGMINGIVVGLVTALAAYLWHGNPFLGLVVGLAMFVNLVIAGLAGAAIPLGMKALGMDPAQCSNIILTTFTDVMGFFSLLGFAVLFQKYL